MLAFFERSLVWLTRDRCGAAPEVSVATALEGRIGPRCGLKAKTNEFRTKLDQGASLEDIRFEASPLS